MQKMTHHVTIELWRLAFEHRGKCVSCDYTFQEGDTSHLGYGAGDVPLYVCDQCSKLLKKTAIRQHFSPQPYELPLPNSKLWRYMDFTKYVSLLASRSLYFTRADCFEDKHEGAKGLKKNKDRWDAHYLEFFTHAIKDPPQGHKCELTADEVEQQAKKLLADLEIIGVNAKLHTFVSCWYESEYESEAMWRLYSSFVPNAIAVRTTYTGMYLSLGRDPFIDIGRVRYIDLKTSYAGINDSFWRKRKSFEHEREVRAVAVDRDCKEQGKLINCDLSLLIEEVFVSPKAPTWFVELVNDVNEKYGLQVMVSESEMFEEPFF